MNQKRYRVAQWATGATGMCSLRAVIEHPQLELVGVYVYSHAKAGRDAGDLCGMANTGVVATTRIEDILAAAPEAVLYMPLHPDIDVMCRLLESGINLVSTRPEFHHPPSLDPEWRSMLEVACGRGGASLYSTGSTPGFSTEALPLALLSLVRRLDCLTHEDSWDISWLTSPQMLFDVLGFGRDPSNYNPAKDTHPTAMSTPPSFSVVADAIGLPIDEVTVTWDLATARNTVELPAGTIESGTIAAQRIAISAIHDGKPLLRRLTTWHVTRDLDPAWELRASGWHLIVEGDTPLDVMVSFPVPAEDWGVFSPKLTAHRPVNAVSYVCEAAPGIRTTADLAQVIPYLGA